MMRTIKRTLETFFGHVLVSAALKDDPHVLAAAQWDAFRDLAEDKGAVAFDITRVITIETLPNGDEMRRVFGRVWIPRKTRRGDVNRLEPM